MKLLIINPGATSTKIAVFEGEEQLFKVTIDHLYYGIVGPGCQRRFWHFRKVGVSHKKRPPVLLKTAPAAVQIIL